MQVDNYFHRKQAIWLRVSFFSFILIFFHWDAPTKWKKTELIRCHKFAFSFVVAFRRFDAASKTLTTNACIQFVEIANENYIVHECSFSLLSSHFIWCRELNNCSHALLNIWNIFVGLVALTLPNWHHSVFGWKFYIAMTFVRWWIVTHSGRSDHGWLIIYEESTLRNESPSVGTWIALWMS